MAPTFHTGTSSRPVLLHFPSSALLTAWESSGGGPKAQTPTPIKDFQKLPALLFEHQCHFSKNHDLNSSACTKNFHRTQTTRHRKKRCKKQRQSTEPQNLNRSSAKEKSQVQTLSLRRSGPEQLFVAMQIFEIQLRVLKAGGELPSCGCCPSSPLMQYLSLQTFVF